MIWNYVAVALSGWNNNKAYLSCLSVMQLHSHWLLQSEFRSAFIWICLLTISYCSPDRPSLEPVTWHLPNCVTRKHNKKNSIGPSLQNWTGCGVHCCSQFPLTRTLKIVMFSYVPGSAGKNIIVTTHKPHNAQYVSLRIWYMWWHSVDVVSSLGWNPEDCSLIMSPTAQWYTICNLMNHVICKCIGILVHSHLN